MYAEEAVDDSSTTVRYVSGLAALPNWNRTLDGYAPESVAAIVFFLTMLWIFCLW
jgi:hypothetical protein